MAEEALSDEILMTQYANGDQTSFTILYARYEKKLFGFLERRLNSRHKSFANDLFQMTWMKAHQAKRSFNPEQKFSSWIYAIAINNLRDYLGERRHDVEMASEAELRSDEKIMNAELQSITKQSLQMLEGLLNELPPVQREIILLSEWEGFQSKEISSMVGLSDAAVRQHLSRGRSKLQELGRKLR